MNSASITRVTGSYPSPKGVVIFDHPDKCRRRALAASKRLGRGQSDPLIQLPATKATTT